MSKQDIFNVFEQSDNIWLSKTEILHKVEENKGCFSSKILSRMIDSKELIRIVTNDKTQKMFKYKRNENI